MTVPEASVDKDYTITRWKNEIGIARKIAAMKRVSKAQPVDYAADRHFGLGVLAADALHHGAAFGWREGVHNQTIIPSNPNWAAFVFHTGVAQKPGGGSEGFSW
jgi:hypothetical protein